VWVNGHEWAKRQATVQGLAFTELANGFASCDDPAALQAICDRLGEADLQRFFDRWLARIPTPLGLADQAAGYWWELSMRQIEVSRTLVLDAPRQARAFFEALVADNLDLGRPDQVKLIFGRRIRKDTPGSFATKVVTRGVEVAVNVFYQHSRIKQYLKEGRALRVGDRGQLTHRPGLPTPAGQSRRAASQGSRRQPPAAYHPTCRPGLCH
jgi:hypothetical protein